MAICTIEGCGKASVARGWCAKHYRRWKKHGNPDTVIQPQMHGATVRQRFEANVEKSEGCWRWTGYRDHNGYGRLNIAGYPELAHRISWDLFKRKRIGKDHALHRCDNPQCVNPDHLFRGDQVSNNADKMKKKRHKFGVLRGADHGSSKLTEAQILEIRKSQDTPTAIAENFGISRRHVRDILAGRSWKHIL